MPEPKENETRKEFIDRCIPIVIDDGTADGPRQAVAVCNSMWEQSKKSSEDLVYYGEAVKALGDGKVGGYLVRFSTDEDPDMVNEFFTADTDFGDADKADVYYQHGQDPILKTRRLGKADLRKDEFGVWAETQLSMRDEYERFIYGMAEDGKMGWSSGTAGHLVEREQKGKATWLKSWPLGLDASLTPTPAEPRNGVMPLKSIEVTPLKAATPTDELPAGVQESDNGTALHNRSKSNGENTMEINEEKLNEIVQDAVKTAVEAQPKPEPVDVAAAVAAGVEEARRR